MNPIEQFHQERAERIRALGGDRPFRERSRQWLEESMRKQYVYNFEWLGRPIIQNPIDVFAMQEVIWRVQPDLIIETGIAHGGSLIFHASMLELLAACGGPADGLVVGVDIDIRAHNRAAIEAHPMHRRIRMIQGSSVAPEVVGQIRALAASKQRIMVCLDSNHTHDHVLAELNAYAPLVSVGSYCIVLDTFVEDVPADVFQDRPWAPGNSPKSAVHAYLAEHPELEVDHTIDDKLLISVAPDGFLRRTAAPAQSPGRP